jgi:hypothetical protein
MIIELLDKNKKLAYEKAFVVRQDIALPLSFLPCPQGTEVTIHYVRVDNKICPLTSPVTLRSLDKIDVIIPFLVLLAIEETNEH